MSEPWMFEMSKHSMRCGSTSRSSRSRSARRISCDCLRGCFHSSSNASRALRSTSSSRRSFSPRCGTWIVDPSRAAGLEPGLEQRGVGDLGGHQDLARHVAARRVELLQRLREHQLGLGQLVEQEALARHHLAVAHAEDLHRRPLALDVRREQVALLDVGRGDLLRRLHAQQRLHLVAQRGRLLVALLGRRALHLRRAAAAPPRPCAPRGTAARPRTSGGSGRARRSARRTAPGSGRSGAAGKGARGGR